jgi:putative tryptophan/tyrosine transport system substrate-binding protein
MNRRGFVTLLGGAAAAWPLTVRAQQADRVRRIGVLVHGLQTGAEWQQRTAAFQQGLEWRGWFEGRNIHVVWLFSANKYDRLPQLAQEIVALNPDVIFATTTPAIKALQQETRTIPIVFVQVSDPTGSGIVASLARPAGNITGLLLYEDSITGKWLGMSRRSRGFQKNLSCLQASSAHRELLVAHRRVMRKVADNGQLFAAR